MSEFRGERAKTAYIELLAIYSEVDLTARKVRAAA